MEVGSGDWFEDSALLTVFEAFGDRRGWGSGLEVLASGISAGLVAEVGLVGCCFGAGDAVAV